MTDAGALVVRYRPLVDHLGHMISPPGVHLVDQLTDLFRFFSGFGFVVICWPFAGLFFSIGIFFKSPINII